jgi:tetratricopeptide (TPR) repeat protein
MSIKSLISHVCLLLIPSLPVFSQEIPNCFIKDSLGRATNLDKLCNQTRPAKVLLSESELIKIHQQIEDLAAKGQNMKVLEILNNLVEIYPNSPVYYVGRGNTYVQLKEKQNAIRDFEKAESIYTSLGEIPLAGMARQMIINIEK